MFVAEEAVGKKGKLTILKKTSPTAKREAGVLEVQFKPVTTEKINEAIDENLLPSEVYDEFVETIGPVGHPTEKDGNGKPKPLPDDEAWESVKNDYEAMQQVVQFFWELHNVDPKSKTSRRRRKPGRT